jgi:hypothetical protein
MEIAKPISLGRIKRMQYITPTTGCHSVLRYIFVETDETQCSSIEDCVGLHSCYVTTKENGHAARNGTTDLTILLNSHTQTTALLCR